MRATEKLKFLKKIRKPLTFETKQETPNNYKITAKKYWKKGKINYVITEEKGEKIGNLFDLYVKPFSRKRGIGKQLTRQAEQELIKQGVKKFRVEIEKKASNEYLEKLMKEQGYKIVGEKEVIIPAKNMNYQPYKQKVYIYEKVI